MAAWGTDTQAKAMGMKGQARAGGLQRLLGEWAGRRSGATGRLASGPEMQDAGPLTPRFGDAKGGLIMSTKDALVGMRTLLRHTRAAWGNTRSHRLVVRVEQRPGTSILHLEGRLTFEEAVAVHKGLDQAWRARPRSIVVNMEECSFADSAGVAMLVSGMRLAWSEGIGFVLVGLTPQVRNVMEMNRLNTVFETCATLADALRR